MLLPVLKSMVENRRDFDLNTLTMGQIQHLIHIGLGSVIDYISSENRNATNQELNRLVKGAKQAALVSNGNQLDFIENLLTAKASCHVVLLKGCAMSLLYYPNPHLRLMGDLDILVPVEQQKEIEEYCLHSGFVEKSVYPKNFYKDFHHGMPLFNASTAVWVEVHTALFENSMPVAGEAIFKIENILSATEVHGYDAFKFSSMSRELLFAYTCAHWAMEYDWQKTPVRLLDMLLLIRRKENQFDWQALIKSLSQSPLTASCVFIAITFLRKNKLVEIPNDIVEAFKKISNYPGVLGLNIIHWLLNKHALRGYGFGRLLSETNVNLIWKTLIFSTKPPWYRLFITAPLNVIFPPSSKNKFKVKFQASRLKHLIFGSDNSD